MRKKEILVILLIIVWTASCGNNTNNSQKQIHIPISQNVSNIGNTTKSAQTQIQKKELNADILKQQNQNNPANKQGVIFVGQRLVQDKNNKDEEGKNIEKSHQNPLSQKQMAKQTQTNSSKAQTISIKNESKVQLSQQQHNQLQPQKISQVQNTEISPNQINKQGQKMPLLANTSTKQQASQLSAYNSSANLTSKTYKQIEQIQKNQRQQGGREIPLQTQQEVAKKQLLKDNFKIDEATVNQEDSIGNLQPVLNNKTTSTQSSKHLTSQKQQPRQTNHSVKQQQTSLALLHKQPQSLRLETIKLENSNNSLNSTQKQTDSGQKVDKSAKMPFFVVSGQIHPVVNFTYINNPQQLPVQNFQFKLPNIQPSSSVYKTLFEVQQNNQNAKIQDPATPSAEKSNAAKNDQKQSQNKTSPGLSQQHEFQQTKAGVKNMTTQLKNKENTKNETTQVKPKEKAQQNQNVDKKQYIQQPSVKKTQQKEKARSELKKQVIPEKKAVEQAPQQQRQVNNTKNKQNFISKTTAKQVEKTNSITNQSKTQSPSKKKGQQEQQLINNSSLKTNRHPKSIQKSKFTKQKKQKLRKSLERAAEIRKERGQRKKKIENNRNNKNTIRPKTSQKAKLDLFQNKDHLTDEKMDKPKNLEQLNAKDQPSNNQKQLQQKKKTQEGHQSAQPAENSKRGNLKIDQLKKANETTQTLSQILVYLLLIIVCVVAFFCFKSKTQSQTYRTGSSSHLNDESAELSEDSQIQVAERLQEL